jgi:hypothetical protein
MRTDEMSPGTKDFALHVEEATLQRDHDCVRTIGGAEFREDALEVAFDGVLRDAKLFGD